VYAPADGMVTDTEPLWKTQVHVQWTTEAAEPDEIVLQQSDGDEWITGPQDWEIETDLYLRGMVKDQYGRALYAGGMVPTVDGAYYKMIAFGEMDGAYGKEVWDVSGVYSADALGWVEDTFSTDLPTEITFIVWLDVDDDNIVDPSELQSNPVVTTFYLAGAPD